MRGSSAAWGAAQPGEVTTKSASAAAASDPLVLFLCGRKEWTHSLRIEWEGGRRSPAGGVSGGGAWLRGLRLVVTERASGDVQIGTLSVALEAPPPFDGSSVPGGVAADTPSVDVEHADRTAALLADMDSPTYASATDVRRRLLGTGPWRLGGSLGNVHLLAGGLMLAGRSLGRWHAVYDGGGGGGVLLQMPRADTFRLRVQCWHLEPVAPAALTAADLVWSRPASRCFPTCSDATHPLTQSESGSSPIAQRAMGRPDWTWAGIPGLRFTFNAAQGGGVLVTPWGHGSWGIVPTRGDVLFAEFAQKRHMLRFDKEVRAFTSTRCDDGEIVKGLAK